jgi:hypothetical protein
MGRYFRSDTDRTPSPSPMAPARPRSIGSAARGAEIHFNGHIDDRPGLAQFNHGFLPPHRPDPSNRQRLVFKPHGDHKIEISTVPPGMGHPVITTGNLNGNSHRRSRPETSHQKAVNMNRKMRIDHILHKQMLDQHTSIRKEKRRGSSSFGFMAMRRIRDLPDNYDTENEISWGPGGLVPNPGEKEDFGEAALQNKKVLDRAVRRLLRDDNGGPLSRLVKGYRKRKRKHSAYENDRERSFRTQGNHNDRQDARADRIHNGERQEGLDDLDLDLLGESRDDDPMEDELDDDSMGMDDSEGEGDDVSEDDLLLHEI